MQTILVVTTLVSLALTQTVPSFPKYANLKTEKVDAATVDKQYKVLELLENLYQTDDSANYYTVGKNYDIKANIKKYEKPEVVDKFLTIIQKDFLPKLSEFSILNDKIRVQAKAMYDLFYYAKDFETFYKTAAYMRIYYNTGMFAYTFYVAVIQRTDTAGLVVPAFYEITPLFYVNLETLNKIFYGKMRGEPFEEYPEYGIVKEGDFHFYYQNYSDYFTYGDEYKLAYLTEDIGWNTFYTYFQVMMPYWLEGKEVGHGIFKERRGEIYNRFYQQLLARYYLERLSNGMGEIPTFSWYKPFKYVFRPFMTTKFTPFAQRTDNYVMQNNYNLDDLRFIRNYEDMFLTFLEQGQFTAFNEQVDFTDEKSINFVGNYWQANPDLYEKLSGRRNYYNSYEIAARRVLGGAPSSYGYNFLPTALDFYQTSLRDPALYQLYKNIWHFMAQYKQYLPPYTQKDLLYVGVNVTKIEVSDLETFFDFYSYNVSNAVIFSKQELAPSNAIKKQYAINQPRLNHEAFSVKISVKSEVEDQATFKVFIGPKYDSYNNEIKFEDNWMNFVELDWFSQKLNKGDNEIERSSNHFFFYKEDSSSTGEIYKLLGEGKLPTDMIYNYEKLPKRLMLPRGKTSGFPLQIFVAVYKNKKMSNVLGNVLGSNVLLEGIFSSFLEDMPLGYPLDRPVTSSFFQPNMRVQNVVVYHKGSEYPTPFVV